MRKWVGGIGACIAGAALVTGVVAALQARGDASLQVVPGEVLEVETDRSMLLVRSNSPDAPTHESEIRVRYRWTVDGTTYEGTRYAFDREHEAITDVGEAAARVAFLEQGPVDVLVSPDDPSVAVLARRDPTPRMVLAVLGFLGLVVCLAVLAGVRHPLDPD
jgi:hypothetical protein